MKAEYLSVTLSSFVFLALSAALYVHVPGPNAHRDVDSRGYEKRALLYLDTGSFVDPAGSARQWGEQPHGYPFFISLVYRVTRSTPCLIWVQILLTLATGLVFFVATRRLFGPTVACVAHALFSVNLGYLVYAQFILAEALLAFLLVLSFERLTRFLDSRRAGDLGLSGLALGLSLLVKPAALFYVVPLALLLVLFFSAHKGAVALLVAGFLAAVPFYRGSVGTFNLYVQFGSKVEAARATHAPASERREVRIREKQRRLGMNRDHLEEEFWAAAADEPALFARTWAREMIKTGAGLYLTSLKVLLGAEPGSVSFFLGDGSLWSRAGRYVSAGTSSRVVEALGVLEIIHNALRYLLAAVALCWLAVRRRWPLVLLFTSHVLYFTLVTGFDGCARYRTMFEFTLLMLAALGLTLVCAPHRVKKGGATRPR